MSVIQLVFNDTYEGWRWKKFIFVLDQSKYFLIEKP